MEKIIFNVSFVERKQFIQLNEHKNSSKKAQYISKEDLSFPQRKSLMFF